MCDDVLAVDERNGSNTPTVAYTRGTDLSGTLESAGGIGGLLARSTLNSQPSTHAFYHADGNGNITCLITNQTVVASYRYDPYGRSLYSSGSLANANVCRFSSKPLHANSGLYYYGYRFYWPELERWINQDPLGDSASGVYIFGDLEQRMNRWAAPDYLVTVADSMRPLGSFVLATGNPTRFVGNGAINYIDPYGLDWLDCVAKCIEKNDPFNLLERNRCLARLELVAFGGTIPWTALRPFLGRKGGTQATTLPSLLQFAFERVGWPAGRLLRKIGRWGSQAFVTYGVGMTVVEVACGVQCASSSESFDW